MCFLRQVSEEPNIYVVHEGSEISRNVGNGKKCLEYSDKKQDKHIYTYIYVHFYLHRFYTSTYIANFTEHHCAVNKQISKTIINFDVFPIRQRVRRGSRWVMT
jgi:hypothetical protein